MIVPPPWRLQASGYALLFAPHTPCDRAAIRAPIRFVGGFGLLLLLEYGRSAVGPYREALYIPGYASARATSAGGPHPSSRSARRRLGHSIAWIVVSTPDSRDGGIANWGIPKQLGGVERSADAATEASFLVTGETGERLLRVDVPCRAAKGSGARSCRLPISSRLLPHTLIQAAGSTVYQTRVTARGSLRAARRASIVSYAPETAEIARRLVLATFEIAKVRLTFPAAFTY